MLDGFCAIAQNLASITNCAIARKLLHCVVFTQVRKFFFATLVAQLWLCNQILAPHSFIQSRKFLFYLVGVQLRRYEEILALRVFCTITQKPRRGKLTPHPPIVQRWSENRTFSITQKTVQGKNFTVALQLRKS